MSSGSYSISAVQAVRESLYPICATSSYAHLLIVVYIIFLDALNRLYTLTVLFNLSFGMVQRSTQNSSFLHTVGDMNINNNIVLSSIRTIKFLFLLRWKSNVLAGRP